MNCVRVVFAFISLALLSPLGCKGKENETGGAESKTPAPASPAAPTAEAEPTAQPAPVGADEKPAGEPTRAKETDERLAQLAAAPPCPELIAKLASCAGDTTFQAALFAQKPESERKQLVAELMADAELWKKPGGAEKTCRQWEAQNWGLDPGDKKPLEATCEVVGQVMVENGGLPDTK